MFCAAVLSKFKQASGSVISDGHAKDFCCKKGINSSHTIEVDGRAYRLCGGKGHTQNDRPAVHFERSTVINKNQQSLDLDNNNQEEAVKATTSNTEESVNLKQVSLFTIVSIKTYNEVKNFFFIGGRQKLMVENFAAARQQVLDNRSDEERANIKCYVFQYGSHTYAMKHDGSWAEITNCVIKQDKFRK